MSKQLKQWLKLVSDNQRLLNLITPTIRKSVLSNPPMTVINLTGDKQLKQGLFVFDIIITIDLNETLVDEEVNGWNIQHEVISIDFVYFGIFNEKGVNVLTDLQTRLIRNAVDSYLRYNYTI